MKITCTESSDGNDLSASVKEEYEFSIVPETETRTAPAGGFVPLSGCPAVPVPLGLAADVPVAESAPVGDAPSVPLGSALDVPVAESGAAGEAPPPVPLDKS
jgi:hypothetical protein